MACGRRSDIDWWRLFFDTLNAKAALYAIQGFEALGLDRKDGGYIIMISGTLLMLRVGLFVPDKPTEGHLVSRSLTLGRA
jgi:hypothetical protein